MTIVTEGAYIAALEKKLMEAERALYGFRAIFNNYNSERPTSAIRTLNKDAGGIPAFTVEDEDADPNECVE